MWRATGLPDRPIVRLRQARQKPIAAETQFATLIQNSIVVSPGIANASLSLNEVLLDRVVWEAVAQQAAGGIVMLIPDLHGN
jgi:hypothetical protein